MTVSTQPTRQAQPLLGCIADDFTGATDLANVLVRGGMRTVQTIGVPPIRDTVDADALVVALKSRTVDVEDAVAQTRDALTWLRAQGCRQFFFKYCSTFDSTNSGNIGPVTEALLDALKDLRGSDFTISCPAFPENDRTVYLGHLFVGDVLLNESGMQHHPLTPMTDPNLVRVLQRQTHSKIGLVRHDAVADGAAVARAALDTLRGEGVRIAIADAVCIEDLYTLGEVCADLPLVTGGSGIALGLPANFRRAGLLMQVEQAGKLERIDGPAVVLAGSASRATRAQVAAWCMDKPGFRIDPLAIARDEAVVEQAVAFAREHFNGAQPASVLIYATTAPEEVQAVQRELGVAQAGQLVEQALAAVARALRALGVRKFVVAGGETSGAVVQALEVQALRIGAQIDPGVPATVSTGERPLAFALKSGNFGTVDFFSKALRHLGGVGS